MRRNKNQQGISKIIEEPEIELKNDSFSIWDYLHAFSWVVLIVTLVVPVYAAITNPPSRSLTTWLLIAYIVLDLIITIFYLALTIPTDKRIIRKIQKAGYECGMHEGQINFKKNDCNWTIFTSNVSKRYRKAVFYLGFNAEDLDKDHALANKLVCIIGHRNPAVVTNWNGKDAVRFMYYTVFSSTKDILREFSSATDALDTAASEFFALKEKAFEEAQYTTEHKVGFQYGEKSESETDMIRAQKETETTN